MVESNRERVYQVIVDHVNATHRAVGRQSLSRLTGLKLSAIDEHIRALKEDGRIHSDTAGYYEPVAQFPPDEAISVTVLQSGMRKVEKGDTITEWTPHEWAVLGSLAQGASRELVERHYENSQNGSIAQLKAMVREQGRQLADMTIRMARWQKANQKDLFEGSGLKDA
jgi:biotin operon repressor